MNLIPQRRAALAALSALAIGLAACGDDDSDESNGGSAASPPAAAAPEQEPLAKIDELTGSSTKVTLDEGFVTALGDLKLTPAPVKEGSISEAGVASFPITGGNVTYFDPEQPKRPFVVGNIEHDGSGLSLTSAEGKKVELTDFVVDPGTSVLTGTVSVDGEVAVESAPLFDLDGSTLKPLRMSDDKSKAVLEGTTVKLTQEAADLLNKTFEVDALADGLVIGIAKITVNVT